jgi:hypothetical protein
MKSNSDPYPIRRHGYGSSHILTWSGSHHYHVAHINPGSRHILPHLDAPSPTQMPRHTHRNLGSICRHGHRVSCIIFACNARHHQPHRAWMARFQRISTFRTRGCIQGSCHRRGVHLTIVHARVAELRSAVGRKCIHRARVGGIHRDDQNRVLRETKRVYGGLSVDRI